MEKEKKKQQYQNYIKEITPKNNLWKDCLQAFFSGGLICMAGQGLQNLFLSNGVEQKEASAWTLLILILVAVFLTGFRFFAKLTKWCGAGILVPITGFANSVASPAIEYKKEGQVFGIGVRIFSIAGPVILYGVVVSWILGLLYWLGTLFGIV